MTRRAVLELMHTSRARWNTLRAEGFEVRLERRPDAGAIALKTHWEIWGGPSTFITRFRSRDEPVEATARTEGGLRGATSEVPGGATMHPPGPGRTLVSGALALPALQLNGCNSTEVAGRAAFRVWAQPIARPNMTPYDDGDWEMTSRLNELDGSADGFRLTVDAERGVLLEVECLSNGEVICSYETTVIVFDQTTPTEAF
jgi:hypothetical protein